MEIVKLRKGNRIVRTDRKQAESYLKDGYDQVDEQGKVVKRATGGRHVSLAEYNKALEKIDKLEKANGNAKLEKEIEKLKRENATLKGQITRLQNEQKK